MNNREGRGFTIDHPLLTVLILTIATAVFEYAASFLFFTGDEGGILYTVAPMIWGVASLCILVRAFLWRLLR